MDGLLSWLIRRLVAQTAECCCRRCRAGDPDCSGRGQCTRFGNQSICVCHAGFTGDDCSLLVCPGTPTCSAHGTVQSAVFLGLRHHAGTLWCWNGVLKLACDRTSQTVCVGGGGGGGGYVGRVGWGEDKYLTAQFWQAAPFLVYL